MSNQIYVASLSDYNNGILHGTWISLDNNDIDGVWKSVKDMLKASPASKKYGDEAEEWAIHDYDFNGIRINEYESFEQCLELADAVTENGDPFVAYWNYVGSKTVEEAINDFQDAYVCAEEDFADYADELFDECYLNNVPENIRFYIDYEKFRRDLLINDYHEEGGHIFRYM